MSLTHWQLPMPQFLARKDCHAKDHGCSARERRPLPARSGRSTLEASRPGGGLGLNELLGHTLWELHLRPVHDLTSLDS